MPTAVRVPGSSMIAPSGSPSGKYRRADVYVKMTTGAASFESASENNLPCNMGMLSVGKYSVTWCTSTTSSSNGRWRPAICMFDRIEPRLQKRAGRRGL
jgi:hypothetical protein